MTTDDMNIKELGERFEKLKKKRIQAETKLDESTKELEKLRKEALETFGTDDVDQLEAKLNKMKAENDRKRTEFEKQLGDVEQKLEQVESEFSESVS